jgi:hypothetical protein
MTDELLHEIISEEYLNVVKFLFTLVGNLKSEKSSNQFTPSNYDTVLNLISNTLSFAGSDITIYAPYVMKLIRLFHKILNACLEYLGEMEKTSCNNIASFIVSMIERNDGFFCRNQDKVKKSKKTVLNPVRLTNEQFGNGSMSNKYFQDLLNDLKTSCALFYNKGRNIGYPDFAICITARLRKNQHNYESMTSHLRIKNSKEDKKDSRIGIYVTRAKKIQKLIEAIQKTTRPVVILMNQYANSTTPDTHQLSKLLEF